MNVAYNFFTYWPETCDEPLPQKTRFLRFRLDEPVGSTPSRGVIKDHGAMLHIFPPAGKRMQDMPVGQTVVAPEASLRFHVKEEIYFLRFVESSTEDSNRALPDKGSSPVTVTRESEHVWRIEAKPGSSARLSKWEPTQRADLGLYRFSFELRVQLQRPSPH
jgi:hypothetical protein